MTLTYKQLSHLINLHRSLKKFYSYNKLSTMSIEEATELIKQLRGEANEKLRVQYLKYYGREPDNSEL